MVSDSAHSPKMHSTAHATTLKSWPNHREYPYGVWSAHRGTRGICTRWWAGAGRTVVLLVVGGLSPHMQRGRHRGPAWPGGVVEPAGVQWSGLLVMGAAGG